MADYYHVVALMTGVGHTQTFFCIALRGGLPLTLGSVAPHFTFSGPERGSKVKLWPLCPPGPHSPLSRSRVTTLSSGAALSVESVPCYSPPHHSLLASPPHFALLS